ncbi:MAG: histidinol dehydrogenase [Candidatus Altiarchaeota archaeon]
MKVLKYIEDEEEIKKLCFRGNVQSPKVYSSVCKIIAGVRDKGDAAVFSYTKKFDDFDLSEKNIRVTSSEIDKAYSRIPEKLRRALGTARDNIRVFHKKQYDCIEKELDVKVADGVVVGEKTVPIDSVGLYVPGGRAAYPSTVLMNAVPAKVCGVARIVVASPPLIADSVLAACKMCGVDEVYQVGGVQAIAALAYGTESVPSVSKIVGPGNKYVACAKTLVYGKVDTDMPAGPSEILILADENANPEIIKADMLAQAEHDPDAVCVLATTDKTLPGKINVKGIQFTSVIVDSTDDAVSFTNQFAPEHLEVLTEDALGVSQGIVNAGSIFIGEFSLVVAGDYASGGNHVLPTGGAARFSSPLSVRDFLKTFQTQTVTKKGLSALREIIAVLAESEGLVKHKRSVDARFTD